MKTTQWLLLILVIAISLTACGVGSGENNPASSSLDNLTPSPVITTPAPSLTPARSETPVATATITLSPEQPVTALEELLGEWDTYWSDQTTLFIEFSTLRRAVITFADGTLIGRDTFSLENGLLTWETVDESLGVSTACAANPVATYAVYITRRGDQPVSLRFELIGEDACVERGLLFNGQTLRWVSP